MDLFTLNITEIADLATQVATNGALQIADLRGDELFEMIVGIAALVYETGN
jgi:hypothetical protein